MFPVVGRDMLARLQRRVVADMPNQKQNWIPHMSGSRAHEGVIQQREEENGGKGKIKQVSTNIGMKRRRKKRH